MIDLQPTYLVNDFVELVPLKQTDFEELYAVASDPLIWEQHPNPDRYKRDVFANFFEGALQSKGAFIIRDKENREAIGCTRFYDYVPEKSELQIGYTFYARSAWGKGINPVVKKLMLDYAFDFVDQVIFHVGANNIRSQKAMEKLGAVNLGLEEVAYYGEATRTNIVYAIYRDERSD
jgi:RimJ/RimL family protein N-acetyltransferase